ncbi:MAG: putative glycosyl hydrolase [Rhizobium sp.]|nr:putative glycosyl hydrolase [Rhizobium sp.]
MAELGIVAGLYDDYNWNSGQAGGRTVEGNDHLRERHLFWAVTEQAHGTISEIDAPFSASMGKDIRDWLYDGGRPRFGAWELVSAMFCPASGSLEDIVDVSSKVAIHDQPWGCAFALEGGVPNGSKLLVAVSARCVTSRLINYLLPEAGERFVDVGLRPFAEALSGLMPDPLSFLFYDQPAAGFYTWREMTGALGNSLLYAPILREAAEAASGRPFGVLLLALLMDVGPETAALRSCFFRTYGDLLNRGFFEPLKRFCRAHGLRLTGHEVLPHVGSWALNGGFTSIDPRVAPAVDFFGIDAIRDETAVDANNFEDQLSPKMGDSVARANGRSRAIVEIYATATRTERRAAGQWELSPALLRAQSIRMHLLGARQVLLHALYQTDGSDENESLFVNPRFDFAPGINFEPWWPYYRYIADETARLSVFLEDMVPETPVALYYSLDTALVEGPRYPYASAFGRWCEILEEIGCGYMIVDESSLERAIIDDGLLRTNGMAFSAVALPSVTRLSQEARQVLSALEKAGGSIWMSDFAQHVLLDCSAISTLVKSLPRGIPDLVAASAVRRAFGIDASGWCRYALFNEAAERQPVEIRGASEVEIWNCQEGRITRHGDAGTVAIELEQDELLCLRFRAGSGTGPDLRLPKPRGEPVGEQVLDTGWTFRTEDGAVPQPISSDKGWQLQGHAAYSGKGVYSCHIQLTSGHYATLEFPGVAVAVSVSLNGVHKGDNWHPPFRVKLGYLHAGGHELELQVVNTAANHYYAGTSYAGDIWPDPSGLTKPPVLRFFSTDENEEP